MIIDEGFLDNAKKIAETQPQQSEVNVPVIRRENYEYHVSSIITGDIEISKKYITYIISKCYFFKEYGEIEYKNITKYDNLIQTEVYFDSDLFISIDSINEVGYIMNNNPYIKDIHPTPSLDIINNSYIENKVDTYIDYETHLNSNFIYNSMNSVDINYMKMFIWTCRNFGISQNNVTKWMIRKGIFVVDMSKDLSKSNIYPVYINYISESASYIESMFIIDNYKYKKKYLTKVKDDKKSIKKFNETIKSIEIVKEHEFFISYSSFNKDENTNKYTKLLVMLSAAYPVVLDNEYVYVSIFLYYDIPNGSENDIPKIEEFILRDKLNGRITDQYIGTDGIDFKKNTI